MSIEQIRRGHPSGDDLTAVGALEEAAWHLDMIADTGEAGFDLHGMAERLRAVASFLARAPSEEVKSLQADLAATQSALRDARIEVIALSQLKPALSLMELMVNEVRSKMRRLPDEAPAMPSPKSPAPAAVVSEDDAPLIE